MMKVKKKLKMYMFFGLGLMGLFYWHLKWSIEEEKSSDLANKINSFPLSDKRYRIGVQNSAF